MRRGSTQLERNLKTKVIILARVQKIINILCIFIGRVDNFCLSLVFAVNGERLLWRDR